MPAGHRYHGRHVSGDVGGCIFYSFADGPEHCGCLYCGFVALTFGGLGEMIVSLTAIAITLTKGLTGTGYLGVLPAGGLLCFVFGGLLLREYKKR